MTDQATRVVSAGWYQDPALLRQVRWWNGLAWTEHVREKPSVPAAPSSASSGTGMRHSTAGSAATATEADDTAERIAAARDLEHQFGIGTSENEIITGATALGYGAGVATRSTEVETTGRSSVTQISPATPSNPAVQQAAAAGRRRAGVRAAARTATGSVWLISLSRLLTLVLASSPPTSTSTSWRRRSSSWSPSFCRTCSASSGPSSDGRALKSRGFDAPSPAGRCWGLSGT